MKISKSVFLEYFGNSPQLRILDFLIGSHMFDFSARQIARESNVKYKSTKIFLKKFLEFRIVTRKIKKSDYYQLNLKNPFVKNLIKFDWIITKKACLKS